MFGFTYLGGRGTATTFKASLLLPTGKDAAFWDALVKAEIEFTLDMCGGHITKSPDELWRKDFGQL